MRASYCTGAKIQKVREMTKKSAVKFGSIGKNAYLQSISFCQNICKSVTDAVTIWFVVSLVDGRYFKR